MNRKVYYRSMPALGPQKSKNWLYAHLENLGSSFLKCQNAQLSLSTLSQQRKNRSFKGKSTSLLFRHVSNKMVSKPGNFDIFLHVTLVYWHEQCVLSRLLASKSCNHISMVKEKGTSNGHRIERQEQEPLLDWPGATAERGSRSEMPNVNQSDDRIYVLTKCFACNRWQKD